MQLTQFSNIKWEYARALRKKGLLKEAEKALKEALEEQPDHPLLKMSLATLFIRENKHLQSKALAEEVLLQDPSDAQAQYVLGEVFFHEKKYKEALPYFQKAAASDPRPYLRRRIARTLNEMGRGREAINVLDNEMVRDARNPSLLKEKAIILNRMGLKDEALEVYETLGEILPGDQFIKKEMIRLKGLKRAPDKIIKELEIALNMPSQRNNAQLRGLLAQKLKEEARLEEAAGHFEKAWELEPENPFFLKQAGFCYYNLKRYDQAIKALSQALKMDPGDFIVKVTLEKIYSSVGSFKKLVELLEDIVHEHPERVNLFGTIKKLRKQVKAQKSDD